MTRPGGLKQLLDINQALEMEIDQSDQITPEMCEAHFASMKSIDDKVEAVIAYMDICKMRSANLEDRAKAFSDEAKSWERKLAGLENYCMWLLKAYPEVEGRGRDRTFVKQTNQPSMVCNLVGKKSVSNFLTEEMAREIPEHFREQISMWVLKSGDVKDYLKKGHEVNFARLERKEVIKVVPKERS